MFEALELGRKVQRKDYEDAVLTLRQQLLEAQFELVDKPYPVIVIVSGVEGAGKGTVVHRFNEWMDTRLIDNHAFWDSSDEENQRPFYWRFWRRMPARGRIGVFFGSWYTRPIIDRVFERCTDAELDAEMQRIEDLEQMLAEDGTLIVKLWFHLRQDAQGRQLGMDMPRKKQNLVIPPERAEQAKLYEAFWRTSERAIRATDTGINPWHLIEAEDPYYRDLTAGEVLLTALKEHLANHRPPGRVHVPDSDLTPEQPTVLSKLPTDAKLEGDEYKDKLYHYQDHLQQLAWQAREQKVGCVAVFEGWDAAGKGSAIRRVTQAIDPRLFELVQFAAPNDEERAHHYLWRFWRDIARDGKATIFDRSWYGRVLVERVEGFATAQEWQRAYAEINRFEEQLALHGSVVMKYWIHISQEEQLARFEAREQIPHKKYKITEEDWRNRERWHDYEVAVHDMVTHTSSEYAPWTLVAGNDKKYARIQILSNWCERLEAALS